MTTSSDPYNMQRHVRRIHMVGAAGAGMSGIAEVLMSLGYQVSGSDLRRNATTDRLASLGMVWSAEPGHRGEAVDGADVVVASSAVEAHNPEVRSARQKRIPVIRRAEMLAELMRLKTGIAVAGAHGKTTTTSMVGSLLEAAQLDPTVVVGGKLNALGGNARPGQGGFMVVEADESDGSFLLLSPSLAIVTGLDEEHLDYYQGGLEEIRSAFLQFLHRLPFYGLAVLNGDDSEVRTLIPGIERRVVTYGFSEQVDYRAVEFESDRRGCKFAVLSRGRLLARFHLHMVGRHNVQNALAALAVADEVGASMDAMVVGLKSFGGVDRRFSVRGEVDGVLAVDDYGHHPNELRTTIEGAKDAFPSRRLHVVFQPHRYSRTQWLLDDFGAALAEADLVTVTEVYSAGERPIEGVHAEAVAEAVRRHRPKDVFVAGSVQSAVELVSQNCQKGDLIVACGAGSIGDFGVKLLEKLGRNSLDGS